MAYTTEETVELGNKRLGWNCLIRVDGRVMMKAIPEGELAALLGLEERDALTARVAELEQQVDEALDDIRHMMLDMDIKQVKAEKHAAELEAPNGQ